MGSCTGPAAAHRCLTLLTAARHAHLLTVSRLLLCSFKQKLGTNNGIFEEMGLDGVLCVEFSATSVARLAEGCVHTEAHTQTSTTLHCNQSSTAIPHGFCSSQVPQSI